MGHAGYFLGKMKNQNDAQRVAQEAPSLEELHLGRLAQGLCQGRGLAWPAPSLEDV